MNATPQDQPHGDSHPCGPARNERSAVIVPFNSESFARFKAEFARAKAEGRETFRFDDVDVLVAYGAYVIEFLDGKFSK